MSLKFFEEAKLAKSIPENSVAPVAFSEVTVWNEKDAETKLRITNVGVHAISQGTVGAVIMSGGQGTRLGFGGPKGMFKIGLQSGKSIFQLHIERIMKIRSLCCDPLHGTLPSVPVYIIFKDL